MNKFMSLLVVTLCFWSLAKAETKTFKVEGMHCGACRKSIEEKVCKLPGVSSCEVKMGQMTLGSETTIDEKAIANALEEAGGYKIKTSKK